MDEEFDDDQLQCWCGAVGTYDELFGEDPPLQCGGNGSTDCHCGGDQCVCHWHGEIPCDGCSDCATFDDFGYDDDWGVY